VGESFDRIHLFAKRTENEIGAHLKGEEMSGGGKG
jgi:hypothetical protein